jgi:hypothetical protein
VGTRIPARIPGTTKRMRGTAAIGFLSIAAFPAGQQCNYDRSKLLITVAKKTPGGIIITRVV